MMARLSPMMVVQTVSIADRHFQSIAFKRTLGVSFKCTAIYGNGQKIAGSTETLATQVMVSHGRLDVPILGFVSSAAVHGTPVRRTSARLLVLGTTPSVGVVTGASDWREGWLLETHSFRLGGRDRCAMCCSCVVGGF